MKRTFVFGLFFVLSLFVVTSFVSTAGAQAPIYVEDFDYSAGAQLTANGWTAHSAGGTNPITVTSPGLTLSGYPGSGVGNAVTMTTSGEDDNHTFTVQTTGTVYAAFLVNASDAAVDAIGGYFFHLGPDPVSTTFRGRVFIKKDASNNIAFGFSKAATADPNVAFTGFTYSLNTTYLVVVKYTIVDGASNDTCDLFVSTNVPGSEPTPTLSALDNLTQSDISPGTVSLRQGTATTHPTVQVDGIRVGTSWASVTQGTAANTQHVLDYDGDGKTDRVVVRNIGGGANGQVRWFINRADGTTVASDWGLANDFFVDGDFDGDQKSDIAVWRPLGSGQPSGNAYFYVLNSSNGTVTIEDFGQSGDDPTVVGDYNGDGKTDFAVYRAGAASGDQSTWFFRTTPGGPINYQPWGSNGDFPAPGDYDGDGKNDFVIQRNNGGGQAAFWMKQTTAGNDIVVFGTPTDVIVPGDYDGDGKTDIAVRRSIGGTFNWFVRPSSTGVASAAPYAVFGTSSTDFPAQGDYDGDGKTDVAVWRNTGVFWFLGSTSGAVGVPFGSNGDYPVANFNSH